MHGAFMQSRSFRFMDTSVMSSAPRSIKCGGTWSVIMVFSIVFMLEVDDS